MIAPMFAAQIVYLFYLTFAFTGVGLPISMPPGVEDPFLSKIAPDECLYYTNWAGSASPDPISENEIERLYCEPEVDDFIGYLNTRIRAAVVNVAEQNGNANAGVVAEAGATAAELLLTKPTTIFISNLSTDPTEMAGAIVVRLDDKQQQAEAVLEKLHDLMQQVAQDVKVQGKPFSRIKVAQLPTMTWGVSDNYFMFGVGETAIDGILDRSTSPVPTWLSDLQAQHTLPRRATLTYADLEKIFEFGLDAIDDPSLVEAFNSTGLQHFSSYVCVSGLDDSRFVCRTEMSLTGPPSGLLAALPHRPLKKQELSGIPASSLVAFVMKADLNECLDAVVEFYGEINPDTAGSFEALLQGMDEALDIDMRREVLGSLGDVISVYASPDEGGLLTGWVLSIPAVDAAVLKEALDKIQQSVNQTPNFSIVATESGGQSIRTVSFPGMPVAPTWCVTGSEFVFGLYPQAVRGHLRPREAADSIGDTAAIRGLFADEGGPSIIAYQDSKAVARSFYPFLQMGFQTYAGLLKNEGIDVDVAFLPSAGALTRHMQPGVWAVRRDENGFRIESHQSVPGGNLGATAPMIVAAALPATSSARTAARRSQSINNLRQLALAAINHESAFGHYPAAYNTDENGKPLLSWRVHILPFLEEDQLYQEFHLDEPWNSAHNRKLIARMPRVYRSPLSESDPGKTNYVAIRSADGVIVPPAEDQFGAPRPAGTRIRAIRDGTSKTMLMVEASDAKAVIWTKPDDVTLDNDNPVNGLIGLHRGSFVASFCDGHTRVISAVVDPEILRAVTTKDGGEVTGDF